MIKIIKGQCCGCNACAEKCPKSCITMEHDERGFLYPKIDATKCVECGHCERVCPFINDNDCAKPTSALAAWTKDYVAASKSSSGGIAFEVGRHIIGQGGVVYGCAFVGLEARHIRVCTLNDLKRLQGSKYVQSDVRGIFKQVRKDLLEGLPVLFVGTPCQSAGLKRYLGKEYENLYRIDLICHGVPSQKMLWEHIRTISKDDQPDEISFRQGNIFTMTLVKNGETVYEANVWKNPFKDLYYKGFIDCVTYRQSCYECPFASIRRGSDMTIGDFHGLKLPESVKPDQETGLSLVLPTTDKGKDLLAAIDDRINICLRTIEEGVASNPQLSAPSRFVRKSRIFQLLYPMLPIDMSLKMVYSKVLISDVFGQLKKWLNGRD